MAEFQMSDVPGCFGSSIVRSEDHVICRKCICTNYCKKISKVNAERMRKELKIEKLSGETGKRLDNPDYTIAELESPRYKDMKPLTVSGEKLTRAMLRKINKSVLAETLRQTDRNIISHRLQFVEPDWALALLMLIWDNGGEIKKSDLRDYLMHDLGHGKMVAMTNISTFINATTNMDLTVDDGTQLRFKNETIG